MGGNTSQKDFSANLNPLDMSKNVDRVSILELIKTNSPISIWNILKKIKINRNTLYFILRDFEFSGLIYSELKTNESNRKVRMIYYNKKKENG